MSPAFEALREQWRGNRRLRLFVMLALLVLVANLAATASSSFDARAEAYRADHRLLERLQGAATDEAWAQRADAAVAALAEAESGFVEVSGTGQAQAELQALLAAAAATAGITDAAVRTEGAAEVAGLPGVWEVSGRLAGSARGPAATLLLGELARHRGLRVDQIDVRDDAPGQLQMIVRGYYRRAAPAVAP